MSSPSFLVVRFSAIGDCVMAAWAVTAIREKYPQATIMWAAESRCLPALDTERLLTRTLSFPREKWKKRRWSLTTWREQLHAYGRLRPMKFDYGIDFQGHSKTALCLRIANPRQRVATQATDAFAARLNPVPAVRPKGTHWVDWDFQTLCRLGEYAMPHLPTMPDLTGIETPGLPDRPFVSISIGAGQTKNLVPVEHWLHVAEALERNGVPVVALGGPEVVFRPPEGVVNLVGKLKLRDSMAVIARSAVHVAADTGTGHLAAAYDVPTVSVFAFADPAEYRPYSSKNIALKDGDRADNIPPGAIVDATLRQLAAIRSEYPRSP